ncbi:HAD-IA family hydrolase [Paenibacillus dokdonensis]|uniref:HAD-IA family hydrolase n=1 Tax=Paenibacillus dokdonensis TaxID=2567944 RepID=A0ABU6GFC4_9BACL|nr:HAD-IA family hydrolase [Paenibacillus dokdonensis]MEC0238441.1 HAD-IA family hydrolase [Paenibacillus dokdonensis]
MEDRPQLVLDIAGVLVNNISSVFWKELVVVSGVTLQVIKEQFNEIKRDLWTGNLMEEQLWVWLVHHYPGINTDRAREILIKTLEPLPSVQYLEQWSRIADIHLLSNHCREWLEPILTVFKRHTKSITISNQVGLCKPDIQIYEWVVSHFEFNERVLYVDDQEKNLKPAISLGWETLLADDNNHWIKDIEPKLIQKR